jgi:two-component system chemotaxis response regulator CheY
VTATPNAKRTILVVDDVATTRAILRKIFTEQGYEVIEADSGEEAIRLYHFHKPFIVTMDIHMAKVSGLGAIQVIVKLDPQARIIACSSEFDPNYVQETMRIGAKAYITKPFNSESVLAALQKAVGG